LNWFKEFPQQQFLNMIASGKTEVEAMAEINADRGRKTFHDAVLVQLQVRSPKFKEDLEAAKKQRADVWFNGIAHAVGKDISKDDVPAEKLKFEQRKYLAAIDNPEKYSEKVNHKMEIGINIFQEMKDLPANEVKKLMANCDPFAISADFEVVEDLNPGPSGQGPDSEDDEMADEEEDIFG